MGEFPWLWRGSAETPAAFRDQIWRDIMVQYAIEDKSTGAQVGLLSAYNSNPFHGYAYVMFTLLPECNRQVWPYEAVVLFGNYLFTRFALENVYSETTGSLYDDFRSGAGRLFTEVGRYPDRLIVDGRREDLVVTGMSKAQWEAEGIPLLNLYTKNPRVPSDQVV